MTTINNYIFQDILSLIEYNKRAYDSRRIYYLDVWKLLLYDQFVLKRIFNNKCKLISILLSGCINGDIELVQKLIKIGSDKLNINIFNEFLLSACKYGHKDIVDLLILHGANDYNSGLRFSCLYGHKDIVKLILEYCDHDLDFNRYLSCACWNFHKDIAELMIGYGANDFNQCLYEACLNGRKDIVDYTIKLGANGWNGGLCSACFGNHEEISEYMIKRGATYCNNCVNKKHKFK